MMPRGADNDDRQGWSDAQQIPCWFTLYDKPQIEMMQRWYIAIFGIHAPGHATSTCREDRSWHLLGGNPIYLGFSAKI